MSELLVGYRRREADTLPPVVYTSETSGVWQLHNIRVM